MKTLAERHESRAQRIAENRAERANTTVVTAAAAIIAARQAADLIAGLNEDGRAELEAAMADYDPTAAVSLAENENGDTMAGIGVINTKVVPASAESGNGGGTAPGWTDVPETPTLSGADNLGGQALVDQGVAGGGDGGETTTRTRRAAKSGEGE